MKILQFVLVLVFMLTVAIHPVQAKSGERYGFVPLVTESDPNVPLQIQAQLAFEEMLPQLHAAQKSGAILEFEPEFAAGILKIKYATNSGLNASAFTTAQEFDDIQAAVALVPHQQSAGATSDAVNATALTPHFILSVNESCFSGYGVANGSKILGSLYDKTGKLIANFGRDVYSNNSIYGCFQWGGIGGGNIQPGYKATYKIYSPVNGALLRTLTTIVPAISLDDTGRADSVVAGTGPANKPYYVFWTHYNLDAGNTYTTLSSSGTISAQRNFRVDFGNTPLRGRDFLKVEIKQNVNFSFSRSISVRYASCDLDTNYCTMRALPNQLVSATIIHAGVPYTLTERASAGGYISFDLEDAQKKPLMLAPGDTLIATGIPDYRLPNLTASVDFAKDKVQGAVPANSYFSVWANDPYDNSSYSSQWVHSKPTVAYYSADFTSQFDFKQENGLHVDIRYIDPVTGHMTDRSFIFGQ